MKPVNNLYRVLSDSSGMINNDERVSYVTYMPNEYRKIEQSATYNIRPVYDDEITAGLNVKFRGSTYEENVPDITKALDGFHKLKNRAQQMQSYLPDRINNPSYILASIIGTELYDCMSGGMNKYGLQACVALIKHYNCDLKEIVYPSDSGSHTDDTGTKWDTLGDFMREWDNEKKLGVSIDVNNKLLLEVML